MKKTFSARTFLYHLEHLGICSISLLLFTARLAADDRADYIRSNYAKYEYRIPMRDDVTLFTSVYLPYDQSNKHPILLFRTPYSVRPYGVDKYPETLGPTEEFEKAHYIFVFQDVRGCYMSEGEFVNMRPHLPNKNLPQDIDESSDTYDTIEWLINNLEGHNGNVGMWGISYPGFYCSAGMIDSHPALKAVSPQAPIADWFWDDMHHHGAFTLALTFHFFSSFGSKRAGLQTEHPEQFDFGTPDGYQFYLDMGPLKNANEIYLKGEIDFWNHFTQHPNYDEFWQSRNIVPHLKNIKAAVMTVGGLFDAEDLYGPLKTYRAVEENNPKIFNVLVMGPWSHGAWSWEEMSLLGDMDFDFNTSKWFRDRYQFFFFQAFLQDDKAPELPEAAVFETGANRWRQFDQWPPQHISTQNLYFQDKYKLSEEMPSQRDTLSDAYISDPKKPVPYTKTVSTGWIKEYMTEDQRFVGNRPDVLVYVSDVLEHDLTIAGPIQANLYVSTTGTAADWVVKLIDVHPNDHATKPAAQLLVRGEIFRGRFRESYEYPKPFRAHEITPVSFELLDVLHTFKRHHRIMVHIHSTWFPLFDRNPQKYVDNIFAAEKEDFITVTNRIYRSRDFPSHLQIKVLK
ncbi:CocE/NonD family hydrolase [candidate division KSB1 bacterium]|nr:CocE/NonD family hydrolase [candidate division KSB1 bacterium]